MIRLHRLSEFTDPKMHLWQEGSFFVPHPKNETLFGVPDGTYDEVMVGQLLTIKWKAGQFSSKMNFGYKNSYPILMTAIIRSGQVIKITPRGPA
jgi:hypothetical protein